MMTKSPASPAAPVAEPLAVPAELPADPLVPAPLRPGDAVRVVAPASPFDRSLAWRALGWLRTRYEVRFHREIFARQTYLAGSDERRRQELCRALQEPGVRAIVAARGGYGINRFAHDVDWGVLRRHPRWLVGFSDVTALHVEAARVGVASLHACNLTALGRGDARNRRSYEAILADPDHDRRWSGLQVLRAGRVVAPVFGGNLALLQACAAAGRLRVPDGCILLLEDVGEPAYRIDRMLTTLLVGGHLQQVGGVMLGEFDRCRSDPDGGAIEELVAERLAALGVPVVGGMPVGHGVVNEPVVLGLPAELDATGTQGVVRFGRSIRRTGSAAPSAPG